MREILFRGKRTDNGEWVEGELIHAVPSGMPGIRIPARTALQIYSVIPETVGQFTGLTDRNGKRIFEGDIIRYITPDTARATGVVRFGEYGTGGTIGIGFHVEWVAGEGTGWLRRDIGFWAKYRDIEVISNIHDNPGLLPDND